MTDAEMSHQSADLPRVRRPRPGGEGSHTGTRSSCSGRGTARSSRSDGVRTVALGRDVPAFLARRSGTRSRRGSSPPGLKVIDVGVCPTPAPLFRHPPFRRRRRRDDHGEPQPPRVQRLQALRRDRLALRGEDPGAAARHRGGGVPRGEGRDRLPGDHPGIQEVRHGEPVDPAETQGGRRRAGTGRRARWPPTCSGRWGWRSWSCSARPTAGSRTTFPTPRSRRTSGSSSRR